MARAYLTAPPEQTTMPSGIPYIVGNEAAERFSFYGMRGLLAIFMTAHLFSASGEADFLTKAEASTRIHLFVAATYFMSFVGGILADWLWGKYKTILWLSCVYCLGHGVLSLMDFDLGVSDKVVLYSGLTLIAIGSGAIKSCVSAHVGDQFGSGNQHLLPRVFSWFYFSINLGAATSMLLTPWLAQDPRFGYPWAFGVPAVLMVLATFTFWLGRHRFVHVPPSGDKFFEETFSSEGKAAVWKLIPLYVCIAVFWSLYDQTMSRWVLQASEMDRHLFGYEWTEDQIQAVNPFLILILIPIFSYVIYPAINKVYRLTPLRKIGIGLAITVSSFVVPALIDTWIAAGHKPSISWQILAYVLITSAEVLVSITSLEFSYTQAPNKMKSFIMGVYWLSVFAGDGFTALVNFAIEVSEKRGTPILQGASYYWFFTGCMAVTTLLYVIWSPFYRGQTYIQSAEPQPVE